MNALRRKLLHGMRETLPHDHYLLLFLVIYLSLWLLHLLSPLWIGRGRDVPIEIFSGLSSVAAVCYAVYRVVYFHPVLRPNYGAWLAQTPWRFPQTLPDGPLLLMWKDAVLVTVLSALVPGSGWVRAAPALAFVAMYVLVVMIAAFRCREPVGFFGLWFLLGCLLLCGLVNPAGPGVASIVALAVIATLACGVAAVSLRRTLMRLPEIAPGGLASAYIAQPLEKQAFGWPVAPLLFEQYPGVARRRYAAPVALTVAWVYFCGGVAFFSDTHFEDAWREAPQAVLFPFLACAVARLLWYTGHTRSPISLPGRIATGRLIVPRHDVVFLAPITSLATVVLAWPLTDLGAPIGLALGVPLGLAVWVALAAPPTLSDWRLTGAHRIVRPATKRKSFKLE